MADTVHVKGLADLQKALDTLPVRIERNIMRSALRAGMNVVKPAAQSNIRSASGLLAKGLKVGTRARRGTVTANLKATGPHAHVARWIEYGVKPHTITARRDSRTGRLQRGGGALAFGGTVVAKVEHPGFRGRGFMRNALDASAPRAVAAVANQVKARLTKEGINVAHVMVEGDE